MRNTFIVSVINYRKTFVVRPDFCLIKLERRFFHFLLGVTIYLLSKSLVLDVQIFALVEASLIPSGW